MKKRLISVLLVLLMMAGIILIGQMKMPMKELKIKENDKVTEAVKYDKESVYIWYSDDTLTNYLNAAAVAYNESYGTRIVPQLKAPTEFLKEVNKSVCESNEPDMYIITHDSLGEAYLAGLTSDITMDKDGFIVAYLDRAREAVSYKDHILGYPLNFETSVLLYNKTFLEEMYESKVSAEEGSGSGESSEGNSSDGNSGTDSAGSDSSVADEDAGEALFVANSVEDLVPKTIEDIMNLADEYDAPEGVEGFFKWDVNDIFYNYFFIGDAINIGDQGGYDKSVIDIYNENAISALTAYQSLNQFFSIDAGTTDYNQVVQDFIDGKMIYTVATSDVVATLENAKADGSFKYEYGVALLPDMAEDLETRAMSMTNVVVVSPYASDKHREIANDFAFYMTNKYADELYAKSGKVSTSSTVHYDYAALKTFADEYEYSAPLPKMLESSTFWIDLERTFLNVWNGEDANTELKNLAEQVLYQVTGEETELPKIEIEDATTDVEYLDEEELMRSAKEGVEDSE